jgi:hypothetical protein
MLAVTEQPADGSCPGSEWSVELGCFVPCTTDCSTKRLVGLPQLRHIITLKFCIKCRNCIMSHFFPKAKK